MVIHDFTLKMVICDFTLKMKQLNINIANTGVFKSFKYQVRLIGETVAQPAPNSNNGILKKGNNSCAIKISK